MHLHARIGVWTLIQNPRIVSIGKLCFCLCKMREMEAELEENSRRVSAGRGGGGGGGGGGVCVCVCVCVLGALAVPFTNVASSYPTRCPAERRQESDRFSCNIFKYFHQVTSTCNKDNKL